MGVIAEVGGPSNSSTPQKQQYNNKSVNAISQAPLVRQALSSKDSQIFEKVFSKKDPNVIAATVEELSGTEAFDLLQEATIKLHKYELYFYIPYKCFIKIKNIESVKHFLFCNIDSVTRCWQQNCPFG